MLVGALGVATAIVCPLCIPAAISVENLVTVAALGVGVTLVGARYTNHTNEYHGEKESEFNATISILNDLNDTMAMLHAPINRHNTALGGLDAAHDMGEEGQTLIQDIEKLCVTFDDLESATNVIFGINKGGPKRNVVCSFVTDNLSAAAEFLI